MLSWTSDPEISANAIESILDADEGLFVLVNSQQRSGSKYLQGVLASAFGLKSGRAPEFISADLHAVFRESYPINPGHTHGLSGDRLSELTYTIEKGSDETARQAKDRAKAGMLLSNRDSIAKAARVIVFTLIRPDKDRLISSFVLQKSLNLDTVSDADIIAEFAKFVRGKSFSEWAETEMAGVFGVPAVGEDIREPVGLRDGNLTYIALPIAILDQYLTDVLFSRASVTTLVQRGLEFDLRYGLGQRNSSKSRGLEGVSRRVRDVLQAL